MQNESAKAINPRREIIRTFFHPQFPEDVSKKTMVRRIMELFIPAALEHTLLQLTSMFDQIQVGGIGKEALAAVGLSGQLRTFFTTIFIAVNVGVTAMIARSVGQKNHGRVVTLLRHGMLLTLILSAFCSVLGYFVARPLLILFNAPDALTLEMGVTYLRILMMGFIPVALTTTLTAALRGAGNTKLSLYYNIVANIVNILFNWILINGKFGLPALGVAGAAIATVIGQLVAFVLAWHACFKKGNLFGIRFKDLFGKVQKDQVSDIVSIGFPAMLEQGISRIGIMTYTAIVATLGTTLYATHVVCINIQLLTGILGFSTSVVATTMSGQSLGAERKDLAVLYPCVTGRISVWLSFILMAIFIFLGGPIISLYNSDPEIINAGVVPLRIIAIMQPFVAVQYVMAGAMRGAGDTKAVAFYFTFGKIACRPLFTFINVVLLGWGLNGAWIAHTVSELICTAMLAYRFTSGKWMYAFGKRRQKVKS